MNTLKVKTTISCDCCGCAMKRTKSIKVNSVNENDAANEAEEKIEIWKLTLKGQTCKVCKSIINDVAA